MRHIATNAGAEGSIVVSKVKEMKQDEGFNAATEVYEDLVKAGVIDPAKVVRSALQNASSIASLLLTTEALISEIPEAKPDASKVPASQSTKRCHSRSNSRCVAMRQPQTATGSTRTVEAMPSNCIRRSLPMAPVAPSRLRIGASVAWLSDGS